MGHDKLIHMLRRFGILTAVWPLDSKAGKFKVISYKILWWLYILHVAWEVPVALMSIPFYLNDLINLIKLVLELTYMLEAMFNILYSKIQEKRLQKLLSEIARSDKRGSLYEEIVRKRFICYVRVAYIGTMMVHVTASLAYLLSPMVLSYRITPLNSVYPFPTSELWGWCIAYGFNFLAVFQAIVTISFDLMIIIILWEAAFKFDILGMKMRSVFTADKLRATIIMHQSVLSYAQEVKHIVSYIIIKLTTVVCIYIISCNLLVLNNVSFLYATQFFAITIVSGLRLYFYSWSAEMMTNMAYDVSWQIYDTPWIYASPNIRREIFIIIQRCQKPVAISAGIIPVVSIKFYGRALYLTFSYFLTIRAILHV